MGFLLLATWVGSVIAGWQGFWIWLIVPPMVAALNVWFRSATALGALRRVGGDAETEQVYWQQAGPPALKFVLWQIPLHILIFLVASGAQRLFSGE